MHQFAINNKTSKLFIAVVVFGTLATGTINAILIKKQDTTTTDGRPFFHPLIQVFVMFFAQLLALPTFYLLMKVNVKFQNEYVIKREEARRRGMNIKTNIFIPFVPAFIDLFGSSLQFLAIYFIDPSIYVMLRGGVPITTAILSVVFLKVKMYAHHNLGLIFTVIGVGLLSFAAYEQQEPVPYGLMFALGSLLTTGTQYIAEQRILSKYYVHPFQFTGLQGIWGLILAAISLTIANFIPCSSDNIYCIQGHLENVKSALHDIFNNTTLLILVIASVVNLALFNFFGVLITKHVQPFMRAIIGIFVTISVWGLSFLLFDHHFQLFQLLGFIVLLLGSFVYQEIVEVPGINKNTRKNQERKAILNESLAHYDDEDED